MKHTELFEKLKNKIGYKPTQQEIANVLGLRQSVISSRVTRGNDYKLDEIVKIQEHYGICLLNEINEKSFLNESIMIDFYPNIYASCGAGCVPFDESKEKVRIAKESIANYSKSKEYFVISAKGSSMSPLIDDNDKCIVERYDNEQIIDDRVYLFRYNNEVFIKRLAKNVTQVVIKSENKEYQNIILDKSELREFKIIGQIVGLIRDMR